MRFCLPILGSVFLSGTLLSGQTPVPAVVIPAGLDVREGNSASSLPTKYAPSRVQYLYASSVMPTGGVSINSFLLRRDGVSPLPFYGYAAEFEVSMSNLATDPVGGYCRLWDDNRGADFTCVMKKAIVNLPFLGPIQAPPASWGVIDPNPLKNSALHFPLDKPFVYKAGQAFLLEFSAPNSFMRVVEWLADAEQYSGWAGHPSGSAVTYSGLGCPANFRNYAIFPYIGDQWTHFGYCQATGKSLQAICLIGNSASQISTIPLPFDLSGVGAPGCNLYTNILLTKFATVDSTSSTGMVTFDLGVIPHESVLIGLTYYSQQIIKDDSFNDLELRFSRLAKCTIGGGFSGSVKGFQFCGFGPDYSLSEKYARYYGPKSLVVGFNP